MEDTTIYDSATQHEKTLEAAIKRAARRIPVFPCKLDKSPFTRHGFKDATTDPKVIRKMWEKYGDVACVAVPTGEVSGIFSMDEDTDAGKQGAVSLHPRKHLWPAPQDHHI